MSALEISATRRSPAADLQQLSVRRLGPILGGVTTLVRALLDSVGQDGTVVAYVDWESGFEEYREDGAAFADDVPVFDSRIARAARDYEILPDVIRTWPGSLRSDNPDAGIAAVGARAEWLCGNHRLSYGYGEGSPYAKLVEIDAKILMLGAPLDTITLLHHAEHIAQLTEKRALVKTRFDLVLPGPVIGLLLIASALAIVELRFARLSAKLHAASAPTTRRLLTHMGLLFVPAGVGIITEFPELRHAGTALGVGVVVSTLVGVAVTYATMRLLARPEHSAC